MWKWIKEKAWPVIKKYGGYVAAFVGGFIAYLGIDKQRGGRADGDIDKLNEQLRRYEELNNSLRQRAEELEKRLDDLIRAGERSVSEAGDIRDGLNEARRDVDRLDQSIKDAAGRSDGIEDIADRLSEQSKRVESDLERLRKFIEGNAETSKGV